MKRNKAMDVMKGLGIVAVVIGHSESPVTQFIYLYHMPLFFFISGYFYQDKYSTNLIGLIRKRIGSLYKPYLIYSLIFLMLHNVFFKFNIYNSKFIYGDKIIYPYSNSGFIKNFIQIILFAGREPMGGVFWFFTSLFFVNVIFGVISYLSLRVKDGKREYFRLIIILILFVVGNLLTKKGFTIPRFNNSLVMVLMYYIGYMYHRYENYINIENIVIAIICFIGLVVNCFYGSIAVNMNSYLSPDFLIVNALLGIYLNLYISKYIENKKILLNQISYLGKNTVIIMALQFISFKFIALLQIKIDLLPGYYLAKFPVIDGHGIWWILYSIAGVMIPIIIQFFVFDNLKKIFKNNKKVHLKVL